MLHILVYHHNGILYPLSDAFLVRNAQIVFTTSLFWPQKTDIMFHNDDIKIYFHILQWFMMMPERCIELFKADIT